MALCVHRKQFREEELLHCLQNARGRRLRRRNSRNSCNWMEIYGSMGYRSSKRYIFVFLPVHHIRRNRCSILHRSFCLLYFSFHFCFETWQPSAPSGCCAGLIFTSLPDILSPILRLALCTATLTDGCTEIPSHRFRAPVPAFACSPGGRQWARCCFWKLCSTGPSFNDRVQPGSQFSGSLSSTLFLDTSAFASIELRLPGKL